MGNVDLADVVDVDLPRARTFGRAFGMRAFGSVEEVPGDVDLWSIVTPPVAHGPNLTSILARGGAAAVVCEKPAARSVGELDEMLAAAAEAGVLLTFGHQYRHSGYSTIKRAVVDGQLGTLYSLRGEWVRPVGPPARGTYLRRDQAGGGPGMDLATHLLDLLYDLVGWPGGEALVTAVAHGRQAAGGGLTGEGTPYGVEDMLEIAVRCEAVDGKPLAISVRAAWDAGVADERFVVEALGTRGGARLTMGGTEEEPHFEPEVLTAQGAQRMMTRPVDAVPTLRDATALMLREVADAAQARLDGAIGAVPGVATGGQARQVLSTVLAAYESAAAGRQVSLRGAAGQDQ